jgi:HlyD family secretion protein
MTPATSRSPASRIAAGIAILLVAAGASWLYLRPPPSTPGVLQASGRVEGDLAAVGSTSGGRVARILPREGDALEAGALIAEIQSEQRQAELERAKHLLHMAREQVTLARARVTALQRELEAGQLAMRQAEENSRAQIGEAEAGLGVARAHLRHAQADLTKSARDRARYEQLAAEKVVSAENLDDARSLEEVAQAAVEAAAEQVVQAEQALNRARTTRTTVALRSKEVETVAARLEEGTAAIETARARMQSEEANVALARANLDDTRIMAPFDGTVLERLVEAGEIVAPGTPIVTFMDMDRLYAKVYVAERNIAKVKLRDPARLYADGFPGRYFDADVDRVSQQAEFTPRDIHMPDERTKLVFAIKLAIRASQGILKPGMPVDARIRWRVESPWEDGMD